MANKSKKDGGFYLILALIVIVIAAIIFVVVRANQNKDVADDLQNVEQGDIFNPSEENVNEEQNTVADDQADVQSPESSTNEGIVTDDTISGYDTIDVQETIDFLENSGEILIDDTTESSNLDNEVSVDIFN